MSFFNSIEDMVVATAESVRPPERLTIPQAAEKYRKLNNAGSYVGPWRNDKTPYLVEPMEEQTSPDFTGEIFCGPARTGKSDMFFNLMTYTALCDPADLMVYHMTQASARDWSQIDLRRVFRHSPAVGAKIITGRQNTNVHDVKFISGMNLLVKWPTITELSGKTIPRLWLMDYDRMPQDVGGEGSPFDLARKRAATYKSFGMCVAESSPGFEVEDPNWIASSPHEAPPTQGILALYNRGDRRRWYFRCLQCRHAFEADFKHFNYPNSKDQLDAAEQVVLGCPACGMPHKPEMKAELNATARWLKEGQLWLPDGTITGKARRSDIASFWLKGPAAAFQDWKGLVLNYLKASEEYERTGREEALKSTVTVDQGNAYTPKANQSDRLPEELKSRADDWGGTAEAPVVPKGVRFLTATVDVQSGNRPTFVVQVHGHGVGGDVWLVDMFKIRKSKRLDAEGDPELLDPAGYDEDWHLLIEQVIEKTYPLGDGSDRRMTIKASGCDSGGAAGVTTNAYNFWRYLKNEHPEGHHRRFQLVKGEAKRSAPRIRLGYPDSERKDRHSGARGDVPVLFINTNLIKDLVDGKLKRFDPDGGMVSFPEWAPDWLYKQLTAEVRTDKGWMNPSGKRNEAWDLLVYDTALCLHHVIGIERIDWEKPPGWAAEWGSNDLVFAGTVNKGLMSHAKRDYKLTDLAEQLA